MVHRAPYEAAERTEAPHFNATSKAKFLPSNLPVAPQSTLLHQTKQVCREERPRSRHHFGRPGLVSHNFACWPQVADLLMNLTPGVQQDRQMDGSFRLNAL